MKRLILLFIFVTFVVTLDAQYLFKTLPNDYFKVKVKDQYSMSLKETVSEKAGEWILQWDVGMAGVSYEFKKGAVPVPFSAICTGVTYKYFRNDNGVPYNIWSASALLLKDTQTNNGFGIGLYGGYNTNQFGIVKGGFHYDFAINKVLADIILSYSF
jgi:hypothetical protein